MAVALCTTRSASSQSPRGLPILPKTRWKLPSFSSFPLTTPSPLPHNRRSATDPKPGCASRNEKGELPRYQPNTGGSPALYSVSQIQPLTSIQARSGRTSPTKAKGRTIKPGLAMENDTNTGGSLFIPSPRECKNFREGRGRFRTRLLVGFAGPEADLLSDNVTSFLTFRNFRI